MTREEALEMLKYNSNVIHQTINGETDPKEVEALDMAIEALEKQIPKKFKMVDDCIPVCPVCVAKRSGIWSGVTVAVRD